MPRTVPKRLTDPNSDPNKQEATNGTKGIATNGARVGSLGQLGGLAAPQLWDTVQPGPVVQWWELIGSLRQGRDTPDFNPNQNGCYILMN